ncbi:MAG: T9SS type A sorting domain-containing protein [Flavobacterium sp.]|nr:T9SS type A sorting domain-containing protein [Flavobacterium sp.]
MQITDGVIYTLADFYFSSGQAYFRQDNNSTLVFGSVSFPTGTAQPSGPSIAVTGGEWFVTFNRNTGEYSFAYPSIGILGSALGGFGVEDTDLATTDGFNYSIKNLLTINGELKFRKNNSWSTNWGSLSFPSGTGTQDGKNIPVPGGVYNVTFERTSGNYQFVNSLSTTSYSIQNIKVYPNPSSNEWNFSHDNILDTISLFDFSGKLLEVVIPSSKQFSLKNSLLSKGIYFAKINSGFDFSIVKLVKN